MSKASVGAGWQRAIVTLTGTVVGVVVIGTLYWAQAVFIPVALAGFLTFLLSPLVNRLRQLGLPRTPSVIVAVLLAAAVAGRRRLAGHRPDQQPAPGAAQVPADRQGQGPDDQAGHRGLEQAPGDDHGHQQGARRAARRPGPTAGDAGRRTAAKAADGAGRRRPAVPTAVILEPQRAAWMSRLTSFLSPMLEYLGELALAIILVIFMLLKREELRNRIIRLAGQGKIVAATKFVDEAGHRVSRFLLMQAIVNASFGAHLRRWGCWPSASSTRCSGASWGRCSATCPTSAPTWPSRSRSR